MPYHATEQAQSPKPVPWPEPQPKSNPEQEPKPTQKPKTKPRLNKDEVMNQTLAGKPLTKCSVPTLHQPKNDDNTADDAHDDNESQNNDFPQAMK